MIQKKVLLIDDDRVICEVAAQMLSEEGFTVITAQTATLGLEAVAQHKPDLVLLDVVLPDLNGYQVCEQLRQISQHLPIIMLTGLDDNESIVQAYEHGATDFFNTKRPHVCCFCPRQCGYGNLFGQFVRTQRRMYHLCKWRFWR